MVRFHLSGTTTPRRAIRPLAVSLLASAMVLGGLGLTSVTPAPAHADPKISVTTVVSGLKVPWDLTWVGDVMLYDVRAGEIWSKSGSDAPKRVNVPLPPIYAKSEGGLLGMVADPAAKTNQRFYTCQATATSSGAKQDVRVLRWRLTNATTAVSDGTPVITGLPLGTGRHSGCRLRFGADGYLYVGTGDAAGGTNPQNKNSLGGKVLRVKGDGTIPTDNPFYASGGNARYVWGYGHRNVQGLALRPGTSEMYTAEHGSSRDDEINKVVKGANYGWDPVPGYDESTDMTDLKKFPIAVKPTWKSGSKTIATSGLTFLSGAAWGRWQGAMAIGVLKDNGIRLLSLNPAGGLARFESVTIAQKYGRVRTVQQGPDGALYFTTSNGTKDIIGKITPSGTPPTVTAGKNVATVGVSAVRTGSTIYAYVRSTSNKIHSKRSTDDGRTWSSAWSYAGVTSLTAPSAASSAAGRVDLVTQTSEGVVHTWYVNGAKKGQTVVGETVTTSSISSIGDGTLDIWGLSTTGKAYRKHFDGRTWSGWQNLGGAFTSTVGASANLSTKATLITARGTKGEVYERTLTPTANGSDWTKRSGALWSGRALGDTGTGVGLVGVSSGSDQNAIVDRGGLVLGVRALYNSDPDVVTRPDGTWMMFGRSSNGGLWGYDARPGGYKDISLGGIVR